MFSFCPDPPEIQRLEEIGINRTNSMAEERLINVQSATKVTQQDDTEAIGKSQLDWGPTSIQDIEISKIPSSVRALGRLEHSLSCFANSPESSLSHFCLPCSFNCISPSSFKTECRGSCVLTQTFTCDLMKFVSPLHDHRGWLNIIYKQRSHWSLMTFFGLLVSSPSLAFDLIHHPEQPQSSFWSVCYYYESSACIPNLRSLGPLWLKSGHAVVNMCNDL